MVGRMNDGSSAAAPAARQADHVTIAPAILYFGTPVVLLSTENEDGSVNLAAMSSAWALGQVIVLGLGSDGQTARNLGSRPDLVINVPELGHSFRSQTSPAPVLDPALTRPRQVSNISDLTGLDH
jgi:flavin reductase (DIM6/NTAB) family NADH-FMN oxidoreductase RutF